LNQLEIPTNVLIRGNRVDLLERDIKRILDERKKKLPYYENAIHIQIEALLIKLARAAKQAQMTAYERKYEAELISLRNYMYDTLEKDWCLEEMAQKLNNSQSRFSIMYKEYFQVSPIKDLNKMRVERAKVMLLTSDMKLRSRRDLPIPIIFPRFLREQREFRRENTEMRADSTKGMYKKAKRKAIVFYKKSKYDNEKLEKFTSA